MIQLFFASLLTERFGGLFSFLERQYGIRLHLYLLSQLAFLVGLNAQRIGQRHRLIIVLLFQFATSSSSSIRLALFAAGRRTIVEADSYVTLETQVIARWEFEGYK